MDACYSFVDHTPMDSEESVPSPEALQARIADSVEQYDTELAADARNWPPRSFDYGIPTNEAYATTERQFAAQFQGARTKLDYSYHKCPAIPRQILQDSILQRIASTHQSGGDGDRPWVVFTAGAMGVGKSFVLTSLYNQGKFPLDRCRTYRCLSSPA